MSEPTPVAVFAKEVSTGALGAISRRDMQRMQEHADRYYTAIRNRKGDSDVVAIARNTGLSVEDVRKVKEHIFLNHHLGLDEDEPEKPKRFDADYDMAVSWQNLEIGKNIREMDMVLLKHELTELELMNKGVSYYDAHSEAEKRYNYIKYVRELDTREGVR